MGSKKYVDKKTKKKNTLNFMFKKSDQKKRKKIKSCQYQTVHTISYRVNNQI